MMRFSFRLVAATFIFSVGLIQVPAVAEDVVVPSERVTSFVHIREQPTTAGASKGRLRPGESLPFVRNVPRWREVRLPDGTSGFVSKSWTEVVAAPGVPVGVLLRIHFFSVGSGACTLVECPGSDAAPMFIDCGATDGSGRELARDRDATRTLVQGVLARHTAAPNVVVTHGHTDHFNWIQHMLQGVTPGHIWRGGRVSDYPASFNTWVTNQRDAGAVVHEGMAADWHNGGAPLGADLSCGLAQTYVLTVNGGTNESSRSLVLMIEYEDFTAVFPGDAQQVTQDNAIRNFPGGLKTTVLSASHHGASSAGSNNEAWVEATSPEIVVYSTGRRHGHPTCTAVERYHARLAHVPTHPAQCDSRGRVWNSELAEYVTDIVGDIAVETGGRSPARLTCQAASGCVAEIGH
jgi:beta-lactamase superfamily II metal-dependent hydrolase